MSCLQSKSTTRALNSWAACETRATDERSELLRWNREKCTFAKNAPTRKASSVAFEALGISINKQRALRRKALTRTRMSSTQSNMNIEYVLYIACCTLYSTQYCTLCICMQHRSSIGAARLQESGNEGGFVIERPYAACLLVCQRSWHARHTTRHPSPYFHPKNTISVYGVFVDSTHDSAHIGGNRERLRCLLSLLNLWYE